MTAPPSTTDATMATTGPHGHVAPAGTDPAPSPPPPPPAPVAPSAPPNPAATTLDTGDLVRWRTARSAGHGLVLTVTPDAIIVRPFHALSHTITVRPSNVTRLMTAARFLAHLDALASS